MTEPYTPTTDQVREKYAFQVLTTTDSFTREANRAEFDRWFLQEIERAEYSGYLRAVREGLHR